MATESICAELQEGYDLSCDRKIVKGYNQEVVFINHNDVNRVASTINALGEGPACKYNVKLTLKPGKKGVRVKLPVGGNSAKGSFDKSTLENGLVEYLHKVQILKTGVDEKSKCILDKLDHGKYVAAIQAKDGTVEVYGFENGISTPDYTFDITEGGGPLLVLQNKENEKENYMPFVYVSANPGSENEDFNSLFEQPANPAQ